MPVLKNARYEDFAIARAEGKTADEAYVIAGYTSHPGNAHRLSKNDTVKARVAELLAKKEKAFTSSYRWDAAELFERQVMLINKAVEAGKIKEAIDGNQFIMKCLGYEDGPTLTHEHLKGVKLSASQAEDSEKGELKKAGAEMTKALDAVLKAQAKRSKT